MISRFSRCFAATSSNVGQAKLSRNVLGAFEEGINKRLPTWGGTQAIRKTRESRDQNLSLNYLLYNDPLFSLRSSSSTKRLLLERKSGSHRWDLSLTPSSPAERAVPDMYHLTPTWCFTPYTGRSETYVCAAAAFQKDSGASL